MNYYLVCPVDFLVVALGNAVVLVGRKGVQRAAVALWDPPPHGHSNYIAPGDIIDSSRCPAR